MAKRIRTKPCGNCKRSKVKCEYDSSLPCVRCLNNGLGSSCHFVFRLPSMNFPSITPDSKPFEAPPSAPHNVARPLDAIYKSGPGANPDVIPKNLSNSLPNALANPPLNALPNPLQNVLPPLPALAHPGTPKARPLAIHPNNNAQQKDDSDLEWRSSMENKLDSVDAKFNDILSVLQANQQALMDRRDGKSHSTQPPEPPSSGLPEKRFSEDEPSLAKRARYGPADFRDNVLSIDEAKTLFKFFDENIAQQLFGFEIKRFAVDVVWDSSPILVCAICTIASMHYPGPEISAKQNLLQKYLRELCSNVLFSSRPRTEHEAFNTIVSLVLCSFWLSDSQMFTGLALQLAKEFHLNRPMGSKKSTLCEQDRLKLWYLLFILDGQQSMAFNRQALVSTDDYTLQNPRQLLIEESRQERKKEEAIEGNRVKRETTEAGQASENGQNGESTRDQHVDRRSQPLAPAHGRLVPSSYARLTDLRLVSQVEYNIALSESFRGNAWDLLAPHSFGIPSRSNLELDKWMVSWTVLLAPMNNGAVWSSKSTLIYYNFAKMHINSSVIRQLQQDRGEALLLPNWKKYKPTVSPTGEGRASEKETKDRKGKERDHRKGHGNEAERGREGGTSHSSDSVAFGGDSPNSTDDSDSDSDDFLDNSALVTQDQALVSYNIAVAAAQTVLNLVLGDPDISTNLRYVPVHIHMMLYYAAILLVSPPAVAKEGDVAASGDPEKAYFHDVLAKLRTVRSLQKKVYLNLPTDRHFGDQLLRNLENLFDERTATLMDELHQSRLDVPQKADLINEISMLQCTLAGVSAVESMESSRESSPRPEKMAAWPGSHHGHP